MSERIKDEQQTARIAPVVGSLGHVVRTELDGVEIRIGPFQARTGKDGRAEIKVSRGDFQIQLWRTAHIAEPQPIRVGRDDSLELTMLHVPEEHPDARWVR